jgi:hypothetical protein
MSLEVCPSCGFELRIGELYAEFDGLCRHCFERFCEEEMAEYDAIRERAGEPKMRCVVVDNMIQCQIVEP